MVMRAGIGDDIRLRTTDYWLRIKERGMLQHELLGVVEQDGDGYFGHCDELGTSSWGRTVDEAFANLQAATWRYLEQQGVTAAHDEEAARGSVD